jgi:hypothetical protein
MKFSEHPKSVGVNQETTLRTDRVCSYIKVRIVSALWRFSKGHSKELIKEIPSAALIRRCTYTRTTKLGVSACNRLSIALLRN